jgi:hypothetical protein
VSWIAPDHGGADVGLINSVAVHMRRYVNVEAHQLLPRHCHHSLNTVAAMLGQWRRRRLAFGCV